MSRAQTLFYFYKEQTTQLQQNIVRSPEQKAMHRARVAVKKLRAWADFVHRLLPNHTHPLNRLTELSVLYKQIGSLRDAQVAIELVHQLGVRNNWQLHGLESFIQTVISVQASKPFFPHNLLAQLSYNEPFVNKLLANANKRFSDKKLLSAHRALQKSLQQQAQKVHTEKDLHAYRRRFKAAMYATEYIHTLNTDLISDYSNETIGTQASQLGRWHDYTVLLSFCKAYASHNGPAPDYAQLEQHLQATVLSYLYAFRSLQAPPQYKLFC